MPSRPTQKVSSAVDRDRVDRLCFVLQTLFVFNATL